MKVIAVTGRSGSGKSTVSAYYGSLGYPVLDADRTAREVTRPGGPCLAQLCDAFGSDILRPDGTLDRDCLAARAFATPEAQQKKKSCKVGDEYAIPLKTKDFGRIAAQTAKHVIRQGLKEAERSQMYAEMQSKAHEIISAVVTNIEPVKGIVTLELGKGGVATLPRNEQVAGEELREGQHVKVYVVDVMETERGPRMMISRTHPGLVKRMFEMEVPEIFDGTVEIKAISREAGARTKMAVWSKDENVDPVGACIGPRGQRVANIVEELGGEKIDIVRWSEDPAQFISAALSPATVVGVELLEGDTKSCRVTVPDHQLSLAIGNKGQNARLCARLTGYNIDIRPESGYYGEEPPMKKTPEPAAEE